MRPAIGYALLCFVTATVLPVADAQAHAVLLHNRCEGPRLEALQQQLRVVDVQVQARTGPVPSGSQIKDWLAEEAGGVVVIVDSACGAQVHGVHGEHYEVSAALPTRAWAVRIAELAYALSPYAVAPAASAEPPVERPATRVRPWSASVGPALWYVSGSNGPMPALALGLAWQARRYLSLTLRGAGSLSQTGVGDPAHRALVRMARLGVGPRLNHPVASWGAISRSVNA